MRQFTTDDRRRMKDDRRWTKDEIVHRPSERSERSSILHRNILLTIVVSLTLISATAQMALADTAVTKLGRGIANIATCWVEVPAQISDAGEKEGAISALTTGVLKGAVCTVGRCLAGVYDVVTFLLPVPAGYKSLIKPEYALSSSDGVYKGM